MRLVMLTALAMVAFAANSVLNRMAVGPGHISSVEFAAVRLLAGALALGALLAARRLITGRGIWPGWRGRGAGVIGLLVYLIGFSVAYISLDAGVGALILFGVVQITMFAGAVLAREAVPPARWAGAGLAFAGLLVLVAPGAGDVPDAFGALAMGLAGAGWGMYSLAGRGAQDAVAATAWNFMLAAALGVLALVALDAANIGLPGAEVPATGWGIALAVVSGAITSGLGYALWYGVVPALGAARAGVAQLTVPVMAALGGAAVIGEAVGWRFGLASALVLGGVALATVQSGLARR